MSDLLRYGIQSTLKLRFSPGVLIARCGEPAGEPIADVVRAAENSIEQPLDYPPLAQAAVAGDKVVLALGETVPGAAAIVKAVVDCLLQAGIAPEDISLLQTRQEPASSGDDPLSLVPSDVRARLRLLVHDPEDRNRLSYLAASGEGKPVYINRSLSEADLVIPIGVVRAEAAVGYYGVYGSIFPCFSDAKTIQRYRSPNVGESPVQRRRFRREVEEAGWLLGLHFLIQVVPGPGGAALGILAGRAASIERAGREQCDRAWSCLVPRRASLVLAAVTGSADQQTWTSVVRALAAAERVLEEGGAIALCTDLAELPGPALQSLAAGGNPEAALRRLAHDRPSDMLLAVEVARALERGPVYLLSQLAESTVEELGLVAVANGAEVTRLADRSQSCIVLANAQYATPTVEDEPQARGAAEITEALLEDARDQFE